MITVKRISKFFAFAAGSKLSWVLASGKFLDT